MTLQRQDLDNHKCKLVYRESMQWGGAPTTGTMYSCSVDYYLRALADRSNEGMFVARGVLVKLRVFVADDNPEFLSELVALLSPEFEIVATASDGKSAIESIRKLHPDVSILDLKMPELNGLEVVRKVTCCPPRPALVVCSVESDPEIVQSALEAGALGYVLKSRIASEIIPAVKAAASGQQFVSRR